MHTLSTRYAYLYASLCFFAGIAITFVFDVVLHVVQKWLMRRTNAKIAASIEQSANDTSPVTSDADSKTDVNDNSDIERPSIGCEGYQPYHDGDGPTPIADPNADGDDRIVESNVGHGGHLIASIYDQHDASHDTGALIRMGIFAGIALAFHVRLSYIRNVRF